MRRRVLLSVTAGSVLAGCSSRENTSTRVPYVLAENFRPTRTTVAADLQAGGDTVMSERAELAPAEYADGTIQRVPGTVWRVEQTFDGSVTLEYRIDDGDGSTVSLDRQDTDCVRPEVEARRNDESTIAYVFDCSVPSTTESTDG